MLDPEAALLVLLNKHTFSVPVRINAGVNPVPGIKLDETAAIVFAITAGIADQNSVVHDIEIQFRVFHNDTVTIRTIDDEIFKALENKTETSFKRVYRLRYPILLEDRRVNWTYSLSTFRAFYNE